MGYFSNGVTNYSAGEEQALRKALTAGYGTDSASFEGGRALIKENCEQETMNVLAMSKDDCKVMSSIKTLKVASTVHEVNLREDEGDYRFLTTVEGGGSPETDQGLKRKTYEMKFLQTKRRITQQMLISKTFEDALASEKVTAINTMMKGCEHLCFHGDSSIVPTEFDGFEAQIRNADSDEQNIVDLRGKLLTTYGEGIFDDASALVYEKGGYLSKALFPPALAGDIKNMFADRLRFVPTDSLGALKQIPDYPTAVGSTIRLAGDGAGADKFYRVKGTVSAQGDSTYRPPAPSAVTAEVTLDADGSEFTDDDAGTYTYVVHAVNNAGISEGTEADATVAVTAGDSVTITITAGSYGTNNAPTGYIICRSSADGSTVMEMARVAADSDGNATYTDLNEELPGTASMLLLTEEKIQPIVEFGQLMPITMVPLGRRSMADEFIVGTYGALELHAPKMCALVKNVGYSAGLYAL